MQITNQTLGQFGEESLRRLNEIEPAVAHCVHVLRDIRMNLSDTAKRIHNLRSEKYTLHAAKIGQSFRSERIKAKFPTQFPASSAEPPPGSDGTLLP